MQWLARVFASAFVRKIGYAAAAGVLLAVSQCAHAVTCTQYSWSGNAPWSVDKAIACAGVSGSAFGHTGVHDGELVSGSTCHAYDGPATQFVTGFNFALSSRTGDFCVPDVCAPTVAVAMGAQGQEFSVTTATKVVPVRVCTGGCNYIPRSTGPGAGVWGTLLSGTTTYTGMDAAQWIGLGTSCTATATGSQGTIVNPPAPYSQPLQPGTCPGTVNGVPVVVPCDTTSTSSSAAGAAGAASSASSTASSPGGTVANTSTKATETTCTPSTCTTTTTTTINNPNGTTTTAKDTATEDKGDFCSEHPGNPQCDGEEEEQKDPCDDAPDRAACKNLGTLEAAPLVNVNVPLAITPSTGYGPSNATCPAAQTATLMGHTYSFSWQPFCDLATGIRPVVLALAWLSAAIGFLGLARKGN